MIPGRHRGTRTPLRLAPTARAVRAALALSATMLALGGGGGALAAGTCTASVANTVSCNGAFDAPVTDSIAPADLVPDLTLVIGDETASTVTPDSFDPGVLSTWGGNATVVNHADIHTDYADGIAIASDDTATVLNYGDIYAYGGGDYNAIDAYASNDVLVLNAGELATVGADGQAAITVLAHSVDGDAIVDNDGGISASTTGSAAIGVVAYSDGAYGEALVDNSGTISAQSDLYALGVVASSNKYATLYNSGDIVAIASNDDSGTAYAYGAQVLGFYGAVYADNSGDIAATAEGLVAIAGALEVSSYSGVASLHNTGSLAASASAGEYAVAIGAVIASNNSAAFTYNAGDIAAVADGGEFGLATGVYTAASEFLVLYNSADGSISAEASGYYGARASGVLATGLFANLYNEGEISASAVADDEHGQALAYGAVTVGAFSIVYQAEGASIHAQASGNYAIAIGSLQYGDFTALRNGGSIVAEAQGEIAYAVGAGVVSYFGGAFYNTGEISASASGDHGAAIGLSISAEYGNLALYNDGDITASFDGEYGDARGVILVNTDGGILLENHGEIRAEGDYGAMAVELQTGYATLLLNHGSIVAYAANEQSPGGVAILSGASEDTFVNYGLIAGSIITGDGDDGIWNYGEIAMHDSLIDLGYHDSAGNYFYNYGVLSVDGDANLVHMGAGPQALVPSANPVAFYNEGVIDFQDGAADDLLTLVGDFGGEGSIAVDVDADGADQLLIDGSVLADSVTTIDVALVSLPKQQSSTLQLVAVSGDSVAGNFELGEVSGTSAFLDYDFSLLADIDAGNASNDVFSLAVELLGLSDAGTLVAAVPGANLGLVNTLVGTWRQRVGTIDAFAARGVSLWARAFNARGDVAPGHEATGIGEGGNFDWEQRDRGAEVGIDFALSERLAFGLLLGQSESDLTLREGVGRNEIDADSAGLYATWISPQAWYLDASVRWVDLHNELAGAAGALSLRARAESFNLEAGRAFAFASGLQLEPQLQYTHTELDLEGEPVEFRLSGGDSSRLRLGLALRQSFGDAGTGWQWTPSASLSAVHEFDGEAGYRLSDELHGSVDTGGSSALLELGFTARHARLAVYGNLGWQDGGAIEGRVAGNLGLRYEFGAKD